MRAEFLDVTSPPIEKKSEYIISPLQYYPMDLLQALQAHNNCRVIICILIKDSTQKLKTSKPPKVKATHLKLYPIKATHKLILSFELIYKAPAAWLHEWTASLCSNTKMIQ